MSETEKDIEIDFDAVEKAAKQPEIKVEEVEAVEKVEPQTISAEEGLEAFKKKYEEERQARLDAENRARQATQQAREAQALCIGSYHRRRDRDERREHLQQPLEQGRRRHPVSSL